MARETENLGLSDIKEILLCFVSTVVEQLTQNCKFECSNPANGHRTEKLQKGPIR